MGVSAAVFLLSASPAFGQASFGPIQPFAGAPTPVYVAAPYAAPTALAPASALGGYGVAPSLVAPPAMVAPPQFVAPPQVEVPGASFRPSWLGAFGQPTYQPSGVSSGCGCQTGYRPALTNPGFATPDAGLYGQPATSYYGSAYP